MITTELVGGDAVIAGLDNLDERLRAELRAGIGRAALMLARRVQQDKLMGQVLKVKTNRLKNSISNTVNESGDVISGIVSTPVVYARAHEYGFKGTVTVREHMRTIKQAFGKPIPQKQIEVRAFSQNMNLPERSFLRSALRDLEASGVIMEEIEAALGRAARG